MPRKHVPEQTETLVLTSSRRRCCLCYFLDDDHAEKRGQVAHLNRRPDDSRFENLVWLCLDHHARYDTASRQAKGYSRSEVREYRARLYQQFHEMSALAEVSAASVSPPSGTEMSSTGEHVWRYPLWLVANQLTLFPYSSRLGADGVCFIERVDLPDGRVVIACVSAPGNPGTSITNTVETVCGEVCERFGIDVRLLVWLEHYQGDEEWRRVTFGKHSPLGQPEWHVMDERRWRDLGLSPKKRLTTRDGRVTSKLRKHFDWPDHSLDSA
ncbi:MAG: hypothetical protein WC211_10270 [Dehalococcoidia bacterium]